MAIHATLFLREEYVAQTKMRIMAHLADRVNENKYADNFASDMNLVGLVNVHPLLRHWLNT